MRAEKIACRCASLLLIFIGFYLCYSAGYQHGISEWYEQQELAKRMFTFALGILFAGLLSYVGTELVYGRRGT